ncbi:hypothetical protein JCM9534A_82980 [Catenuloplanes indicus JCM 9534]
MTGEQQPAPEADPGIARLRAEQRDPARVARRTPVNEHPREERSRR